MNKRCFVIQPFNDAYDDFFDAIFAPAISKTGLEPYRVDRDPSKRIPIETIEREIENAEICFAEITEDNPNIWYELGFAFACDKDVVMVCAQDRDDFPFDIQHKDIIRYKKASPSAHKALEIKITEKLEAYLKTKRTTKELRNTIFPKLSDINKKELLFLNILLSLIVDPDEGVGIYQIKNGMDQVAESKNDYIIAFKHLLNKGFIATNTEYDHYDNHEYKSCNLTDKGNDWVIKNSDNLNFKNESPARNSNSINEDDIPF